jgi:hypothetical protein
MKHRHSRSILLVAALVSTSATAFAEKPKATQPPRIVEYGYTFTDDALLAGATGVIGMPIVIRPPAARVTLIRPRTAFVVELLKSVETL